MLELRHLNTLTALRAHGSLAAAADELHVTASAVSHQLKELENYYDISLVNRRTRPLSFTPAGKAVLALADNILAFLSPMVFQPGRERPAQADTQQTHWEQAAPGGQTQQDSVAAPQRSQADRP